MCYNLIVHRILHEMQIDDLSWSALVLLAVGASRRACNIIAEIIIVWSYFLFISNYARTPT